MIPFSQYIKDRRERHNVVLINILPPINKQPERLHAAMHYAVLNGGKRLRPLLVYLAGEALGADLAQLDAPAAAVELIHAYSLVHDDLPAMDNDELRRGKPTCHKAFDESTAILVGDALQSLAFQVLTETSASTDAEQIVAMIKALAQASGSVGMAGGQALDIAAAGQRLDIDQLENLHRLKTGALISASVELGVLAASDATDALKRNALRRYAHHLGLAFQIKDDILDVVGDIDILGKPPGHDKELNKLTYPTLIGLEQAQAKVKFLHEEAMQALTSLHSAGDHLRQLAEDMLWR